MLNNVLIFLILTNFNDRKAELYQIIAEANKQIVEAQMKKKAALTELKQIKQLKKETKKDKKKADKKVEPKGYNQLGSIPLDSGIKNKPGGWKIYQPSKSKESSNEENP
jgi:hypothetical protein